MRLKGRNYENLRNSKNLHMRKNTLSDGRIKTSARSVEIVLRPNDSGLAGSLVLVSNKNTDKLYIALLHSNRVYTHV
jgi:hypothetical protein